MRIGLLGGTKFIGAAILEDLVAAGHDVKVLHRGRTERDDLPDVAHVHVDRHDAEGLRRALRDAEAVVDTNAYTRSDAEDAVAALGDRPAVVLSSQDVYRAFATLRAGAPATDPVPLDESAALRGAEQRYLFRGEVHPHGVPTEDYENLDVEEVYLAAGAGVLRLPMTYGERDPGRREEFVLRRVRAGRQAIPFGSGTFLWSRAWVRDVARAVRLALETGVCAGLALNVAEARTWSLEHWARQIIAAAGSSAEVVRVPDAALPEDLFLAGAHPQHVLVDAGRFRALTGWTETDPATALRASVAWHLENPPDDDGDFAADEEALASAG